MSGDEKPFKKTVHISVKSIVQPVSKYFNTAEVSSLLDVQSLKQVFFTIHVK